MRRHVVGFMLAAATASAAGQLEVSTSAGRSGPCSATLADGTSLVTGGGDRPLATVRYFGGNGQTIPAPAMLEPRWRHICAALADNTVLVAGGIGEGKRPTNSAEIFHPDTGGWAPTGAMLVPRSGAAAIPLADGRVLVVGGQVDGRPAESLEIYDPARGHFEPVAGILSPPRNGHAVAALEDGRVLIAGGTGPGGQALDSTDIFDPAMGYVRPGPRMQTPRTNFSATRLIDGRVLVAGGSDGASDLASAEIFDPGTNEFTPTAALRTARQGHVAVAVPNNGRILIAGGLAGGKPVADGEFFIPWRGVFEPASPGPEARNGELVLIGRFDRTVKLLSTGVYTSPTIVFATAASPLDETIAVTGEGWRAGEEVKLRPSRGAEISTTADVSGRIAAVLPGRVGSVVASGASAEAAARRPLKSSQ